MAKTRITERALADGLRPLPFRIRFYLDSYGVQLAAREIADSSQKSFGEVLARIDSPDSLQSTVDFGLTPDRLADLAHGLIQSAEELIVTSVEEAFCREGYALARRRHLEARENPFYRDIFPGLTRNTEPGNCFVDVRSDGVVFAPEPVDVELEARRLQNASQRTDARLHPEWVMKNLKQLGEGKAYRINGSEVDFGFSQLFVGELAEKLGRASMNGRYKIHWGERFSFGEKGVDCDLIIHAMDDLWADEVDAFVFFTMDTDFVPLLRRIAKNNKRVAVCGMKPVNELINAVGGRSNFMDLSEPPFFTPYDGTEFMWLREASFETLLKLEQDYLMPLRHQSRRRPRSSSKRA